MKEIKLDKNKSTIKQDISMCSNSEIVNTNFNNCSTRDTVLNQKIENETERAINKETELEEKIKESGKIDDVLVNGESVVEDKIAKIDLTSYATKSDVEEEKTERQDADSTLQTNIESETNLRTTADTNLRHRINIVSKNLSSEIKTRARQDSNLQTQITANKTNISNLTTRVSDAESNITALETDLNDEIKIREEADTALENKLTTEISNRESADNTLQENIDSLIVDGGELVYEQ